MRHLKSLESLTYEKEQWLNNRHNSKPWWLPCSRPSQHKEILGISSLKQRERLQMPLREYKLRVQEQVEQVEPLSTLVPESSDVFAPGTLDEEVSSWQDWAFIFKNYIGFMDPNYLSEFGWAETHDGPIREDEYTAGSETGRRAVKLYSVLSSYLKNRPLKILRSVLNNHGFEVWRRLTVELQPTSRSRSLAMAQALVSFPAMSKGASLCDYVLTYEKLVDEYEKLSGPRYDPNLKIGTLLKGMPNDLKRTLLFDMDDKTTYEQLRARLLEYERSSQTWSAENILSLEFIECPK